MQPTSAVAGASLAPGPDVQRFSEAALFKERFLEAILESATDYAIIATGVDGLVTAWNAGARRMLGWSESEVMGRPVDMIFTEEDRIAGISQLEMKRALAEGRGIDERWHLRRDCSRFWASGELMPLRDVGGAHIGFLKILRDRTEHGKRPV